MSGVRRAAVVTTSITLLLLTACGSALTPSPSPLASTFPLQPVDVAIELAERYLDAWEASDFATMHALLAPADRERHPLEEFVGLHTSLGELTRATSIETEAGAPAATALPPQPRAPDLPPPSPTPRPSPSLGGTAPATASGATNGVTASGAPETAEPSESSAPSVDPALPLEGPVPGLRMPLEITLETDRFGDLELDRELHFIHGSDGWQVRWDTTLLFPDLVDGGTLRLDRQLGRRGDIVAADGTVFATNRDDGARIYPQEWLAGQTIGYVSEVTAEDLATLEADGYLASDVIGRSGLEAGAEELLRGTPGWTLVAVDSAGGESTLAETPMVPGANLTIALRPEIQATAQQLLLPYPQAATAVVDPASGDVWALASAPSFNPNSMTIGSTLDGQPLATATADEILNKAVLATYPAGSSFKPFTLATALQVGTVTPASLVTCPPTWQYNAFTFRNYMNHTLPGLVTLGQAMAFSCNTTYMPLSLAVYQQDETALTDLLSDFGFGTPTGIGFLAEEAGIVPDDAWLAANGRGGFSGFEQIQLSIGQGAFLGTALQLANAYAAIGNGGTLWQPRIVLTATLPDGSTVEEVAPESEQIPVTPEHLAYVTDTLQAVVTLPYGTGTPAFGGFGVPVAGKSGTAETGTPAPHAWFPAFAPADAPTISVATVLAYIPLGTGGSDAAPLVRQVMVTHFAS